MNNVHLVWVVRFTFGKPSAAGGTPRASDQRIHWQMPGALLPRGRR